MPQDKDQALSMLDTALKMEEKGRKYYQEAAEKTENPVGKEVWQLLAGYEVSHMSRIREIYSAIMGDQGWRPDAAEFHPSDDLSAMFRQVVERQAEHIRADTGDVEALETGIDFESASVKFYEEHLEKAEDPREKKFLEAMVAEERAHLDLLADMKLYYEDPESWFLEKDRVSLDGA
jgi:rubrerythrin